MNCACVYEDGKILGLCGAHEEEFRKELDRLIKKPKSLGIKTPVPNTPSYVPKREDQAKYQTLDPPLTLEKFEEKTKDLQAVYDNNIGELGRIFLEKMKRLYARLSPEDKAEAIRKQQEKFQLQNPPSKPSEP